MYKTGTWGPQAKTYERTHRVTQHKKLRRLIIEKLGGRCCKCGFDDARALQIDHVHGGGSKERRLIGRGNGATFYKKVLADTENKYQLLCANCNWIKRYENKEDRRT